MATQDDVEHTDEGDDTAGYAFNAGKHADEDANTDVSRFDMGKGRQTDESDAATV